MLEIILNKITNNIISFDKSNIIMIYELIGKIKKIQDILNDEKSIKIIGYINNQLESSIKGEIINNLLEDVYEGIDILQEIKENKNNSDVDYVEKKVKEFLLRHDILLDGKIKKTIF